MPMYLGLGLPLMISKPCSVFGEKEGGHDGNGVCREL